MRHGYGRLRSARFRVRAAAAVALAASVLVGAGCGSESHADETKPVDLSKLDVGSYQTQPKDPKPLDPARWARHLEAFRIGSVMPLAQEIDPALTHNVLDVSAFIDATDFEADKAAGNNAVFGWLNLTDFNANTPGLVAGFQTGAGSNEDSTISYELKNAVMVFESDDAAKAAAGALARSGFGTNDGAEAVHSTQYPSAQITWIPKSQSLASWYPTGKFIILALVINHENALLGESDQPGLLSLSDKAISVTADRMKAFQPTPKEKLAELPVDPQGMLRMTLHRPTNDASVFGFDGILDAHAALLKASDPNKTRELFERIGVDAVSYGAGQVIRTRDAASASTYVTEESTERFLRRIDPPAGLSTARCTKYQGPGANQFPFRCFASFGRYAAEVWSTQQQDVYQRISAQYALLANSR